jgi:tetratricopeptide (TPR) repeat protein
MANSGGSPQWLGTLIEGLGKEYQFTCDDLLDSFWLAQWIPAANWARPVTSPHEPVVSSQAAAERPQTTVPVPPVDPPVLPAGAPRPAPAPSLTPDEIGIYPRISQPPQPDAMKASPIRLPGAFALPRALEIGRALRPFKQSRPSYTRFTLDVDSTIVFFERHRQLIPQLRAEGERWFGIVLVTDDAPTMAVWRRTFSELERLLSTHGAFRHVRRFTLTECLKGVEAKRDLLQDPERRTLILFLTDGVAAVWNRKDLIECMRKWAGTSPMGIVQMFPEYHWPTTTLGRATRDTQAPAPGVPNRQLTVSRTWRGGLPADTVAVPVTTLDPQALGQWAKMVMAKRGTWNPAVVLHPSDRKKKITEDPPPPQRRVDNFRKTASPAAFDLACYLSTVPLSLPVMRVVMEAMIPRPQLSYLAEVLASGLLRPVESEPGTDPELVRYDFDPQVADLLRAQVRLQEAAQAQEAVQQEIRRFVEKLAARRLPSDVFLVPDEFGKLNLPKSAEAFLRIKHELAARLRPKVQQPVGILHDVPDLPQPFLERPLALEGLISRILSATSGLTLDGTGRKVMAAAAARDVRILRAFPGGIYWDAPGFNTPEAGRALYVISEFRLLTSPAPERAIVLWLNYSKMTKDVYILPPVVKQETDLYFMTLGLTGQQPSELERCHEFDPGRCLILARALERFGTAAVLKLAAGWKAETSGDPADNLRKAVLGSLFPDEARPVVHAMCTFLPGEPVPEELVEAVIIPMFDPALVKEAWAMAVDMDFCEGSDASKFPPLRGGAFFYDLSNDGAPLLDSRVADYYFQFFDACWEPVRTDRYLFRNLISNLARMRDFARIEQVLLDPYWYAYKAALFGFEEIQHDRIEISDFEELFAIGRVLFKSRGVFDSLAPEVISESLMTLVANEPEIAQLSSVVEQNLRRGFPQTQTEVSGFHLFFQRKADGYQVHAKGFPAYEMRFEVLERNVPHGRWADHIQDASGFGKQLFNTFFAGGEMFRRSWTEAQGRNLRLPIYLHLGEVPELQDVPWEFLYDEHLVDFFVLNSPTAIVRFLDTVPRVQPLFVPPLRILVVLSEPEELPDSQLEFASKRAIFDDLQQTGNVAVEYIEQLTWDSLRAKSGYHILHFEGHSGSKAGNKGNISLADADPKANLIGLEQLAVTLRSEPLLQLVVLTTDSLPTSSRNPATILVQSGIPAVVLSLFSGPEPVGNAFWQRFYRGIADGYALDEATNRARDAVKTLATSLAPSISESLSRIVNSATLLRTFLYASVQDLRFVSKTLAIEVALEIEPAHQTLKLHEVYHLALQVTVQLNRYQEGTEVSVWLTPEGCSISPVQPQLLRLPRDGKSATLHYEMQPERQGKNSVTASVMIEGRSIATGACTFYVGELEALTAARWILVAGTGTYTLPPQVVKLVETLGKTLAARRLNLVGGGWQGVDHLVGRAFANAVEEAGDKVESRLLQMLPPFKRPDLQAGEIVYTKDEFGELVGRVDAVVLIGGFGGTYGCFLEARKQMKPVYPLPATGGDAKRAFDELFASQTGIGPSARRLRLLEVEIEDDSGIDTLLSRLMDLLEGAHREREWADAMLALVLGLSRLWQEMGFTAYPNLWGYLSELAASAELTADERGLEYSVFRHGQQADSSGALAVERLRNCLPAASIWISFDILRISALADSHRWNKGGVIHALIPLLFEFCPEEAESTLDAAARFEPDASPTPIELVEAAERLRRRYNSVLAERLYRKVLDIPLDYQQDQAPRFAACAGLGRIETLRGNLDSAAELFGWALALPTGVQDQKGLSSIYDGLANVYFTQGEITRAQAEQQRALKFADVYPRERSIALNHMGRIHRTLGDFEAAEKLHREALQLATEAGLADIMVAAIIELGITYRHVDTLQRAEEQQRSALEMSERLGDPALTAQVLNNFAAVLRLRGELSPAEEMNRRALALYEGIGGRQGVAESYAGIGLVCRVRGNLSDAEKNFRLALDINSGIGRQFGVADNYNDIGSICSSMGNLDEAQRMHDLALRINQKAARLPFLADTYNALGLVSSLRSDLPKAINWYQQALSLNESMGRESGIADTLVNLSSAYRRQRSLDEAQKYCERALGINEKIDRVWAIARTCTNLGQIAYARNQLEKAEQYFRRALQLDEKVGRLGGVAENKYQLGRLAAKRGDASGGRALMLEALEKYQAGGFRRRVESIQRELDASNA